MTMTVMFASVAAASGEDSGFVWALVITSWVLVLGSLGAYGAVAVVRGRRLSRRVKPEERRWM